MSRTDLAGTDAGPGPSDVDLITGIETALAVYLEARTAEAAAIDPVFADAVDALSDFVLVQVTY